MKQSNLLDKERELRWVIRAIEDRVAGGFYGALTITFQNGRIQQLKTEESALPPTRGRDK